MTTQRTKDKAAEVHEKITAHILAALEEGQHDPANWVPPWTQGGDIFQPVNVLTEYAYTAGNRFILAIHSMMTGAGRHWGTYNQWAQMTDHNDTCRAERYIKRKETYAKPTLPRCAEHGCGLVHVRKGEHAAEYLLRPIFRKEVNEAGAEFQKLVSFTAFPVFSSSQVDGWEEPEAKTFEHPTDVAEDLDGAFQFAADVGAVVEEDSQGNRACFDPRGDKLIIPARNRWEDPDQLWSVVSHELTHWTGHPDRLKRLVPAAIVAGEQYTREDYAFEELVAELGAAFTMSHLGRSTVVRDDHVEYISAWIKVLKNDPKALWRASSKAEKASGMVLAKHTASTISKELQPS